MVIDINGYRFGTGLFADQAVCFIRINRNIISFWIGDLNFSAFSIVRQFGVRHHAFSSGVAKSIPEEIRMLDRSVYTDRTCHTYSNHGCGSPERPFPGSFSPVISDCPVSGRFITSGKMVIFLNRVEFLYRPVRKGFFCIGCQIVFHTHLLPSLFPSLCSLSIRRARSCLFLTADSLIFKITAVSDMLFSFTYRSYITS